MSGLDALKVIRQGHPGSDVIMLTGHGSIDTAIESIRAGAFDYVAKPCRWTSWKSGSRGRWRAVAAHAGQPAGARPHAPDLGSSFVGDSPQFRQLLQLIERSPPPTPAS